MKILTILIVTLLSVTSIAAPRPERPQRPRPTQMERDLKKMERNLKNMRCQMIQFAETFKKQDLGNRTFQVEMLKRFEAAENSYEWNEFVKAWAEIVKFDGINF
jgi:hypothetical protein